MHKSLIVLGCGLVLSTATAQWKTPTKVNQKTPLAVTYFAGNPECCTTSGKPSTDAALERVARDVAKVELKAELRAGTAVWQTANYDLPSAEVKIYKVDQPCIVLSTAKNGVVTRFRVIVPKTRSSNQVGLAKELRTAIREFFGKKA